MIKGIAAVVGLLLSASAIAEEADKFINAQQAVTNQKDRWVRTKLQAMKEGFDWANVELKSRHQPQLFCEPDKMELTLDQQFNILERYVKDQDHVMAGVWPLGLTYLDALKDVFPCPAKP
jgi:hypothetical protein